MLLWENTMGSIVVVAIASIVILFLLRDFGDPQDKL